MSFKVDKQTLNDLVIFGNGRKKSVYDIFNQTLTRGGASLLEDMFLYPLSDTKTINERVDAIRHYKESDSDFPFNSSIFDVIEFYLGNTDKRTQLLSQDATLGLHFKNMMGTNTEYTQILQGIVACIELMNTLDGFLKVSNNAINNETVKDININLSELLNFPEWEWYKKEKGKKISYDRAVTFDRILRFETRERFKKMLHYIYLMDVYIAVAKAAKNNDFIFPKAVDAESSFLDIKEAYHPFLDKPVANNIFIDESSKIIFLTGANMAGKSTFMKSFGISVFLAHVGFPIPAKEMTFTPKNGIYTTINLPDNLSMGYSHFYAEVLRLKKVAQEVSKTQKLIIVFDELFRGTNVRDAYDATIAVTEAFSQVPNCTFLISTHIMEAGDVLKKSCNNINFIYLPTIMEGSIPRYTYRIAQGITDDRHGMMIINNERILEIINQEN